MIAVAALDPGLKPGFVVLNASGIVTMASHLGDSFIQACCTNGHVWPLVATEGQWIFTDSKASPADILTLAFRAGWQLRGIPAERYMRIPPKVWRGSTAANKKAIQARIARSLTADERALFKHIPEARHGDVLDAIGIGRAAQKLASEGNTSYDWE